MLRDRYQNVKIIVADDSRTPILSVPGVDHAYGMSFDSGVCAGRNLLVQKATTPYVVILDDDTILLEGDLAKLHEIVSTTCFDIAAAVGAFSKQIVHESSFERRGDKLILRDGEPAEMIDGHPRVHYVRNFFLADRSALLRCPWDSDVSGGGEHRCFALKTYEHGLKVTYSPEVRFKELSSRPTAYYTKMRNRPGNSGQWCENWCRRFGIKQVIREPSGILFFEVAQRGGYKQTWPNIAGPSLLTHNERHALLEAIPESGNVLEIGCWACATTAWLADQRPDVRFLACDRWGDAVAWQRFMLAVVNVVSRPNIDMLWRSSQGLADMLQHKSFDVIFIDGNHKEPAVAKDLNTANRLIKDGGKILCHDYGHRKIAGPKLAIDAFCKRTRFRIANRTGTVVELRAVGKPNGKPSA